MEMKILVINEIFRRLEAELERVKREQAMRPWYQVRIHYELWRRKKQLEMNYEGMKFERTLLEQSNSTDPCVTVLGELYRKGDSTQEYYIGLYSGELRRAQ